MFFKNQLKIILKNKAIIFWTLVFPIALATFFNLAFSNLNNEEKFKVIDVAIIDNENYQSNENFKSMIDELSKTDENQIFNTLYIDISEAKDLLNNNKIVGFIEVKDNIEITVLENGINSTIMKSVIDQYLQISSTTHNIITYKYLNNLDTSNNDLEMNYQNYFKDTTNGNEDVTVIYFYTLIGMVCLYGGFFGIKAVNQTEANLSKQGARVAISPTKKSTILFISLVVSFIIQYIEMLLLLLYLVFVLNVSFGNQLPYILLLTAIGCLSGVALGTFIGSVSKKSYDSKVTILTSITMILSFLAGMMVIDIKYLIEDKIPLFAKINPVSLITDGLYSLYYYSTYNRFFENIIYLVIFSVVLSVLSIMIMRRKKYDSI